MQVNSNKGVHVPSRFIGLATLVALLSLLLVVSGVTYGADEKILIVALGGEAWGLNWMDESGDLPGTNIMMNLNDSLARMDYDTAEIYPELALEWWPESDTTWLFRIKEGVKFHKGYGEMTAEDVAFGATSIVQNQYRLKFLFGGIDHWEVVDKYTVRAHLSAPFTPFLMNTVQGLGGSIVSKDAFEELGRDAMNRTPIGLGPFEFEEWVPADHITITKFEDYWDEGYPLLDKVIFRFIPDATVRQELLIAGDVHLIDHPLFKDVAMLKEDPNIVIQSVPGWNWDYISVGHQDGPFGDKRVRQAISYAINRQEIADAVYYGEATPAEKPLPPGFLYEDPDATMYPVEGDLEKARQLLAEAGYPNGFRATAATSGRANLRRELEIVAYQLAKVGIELELNFLDMSSYSSISHDLGAYDILLEDITIMSADPDSAVRWFWKSGADLAHGYSNSEVDDLIERGAAASDSQTRKEIYAELQQVMLDEALYVYIVHVNQVRALRKEVTGFEVTPNDMDLLLKYVNLEE